MAANKGAKDPLTRALEATPVARNKTSQSDVVEQPTPHAQPVGINQGISMVMLSHL